MNKNLGFSPAASLHLRRTSSLLAELSKWGKRVAQELSEPDPWELLREGRLPPPELVDQIEEDQKFNEVMSPDQAHKLFTFLSDLSKHLFTKLLS